MVREAEPVSSDTEFTFLYTGYSSCVTGQAQPERPFCGYRPLMEKSLSIVLSPSIQDYRSLAQSHWGLTDEQMKDMHVHHNPPKHKGGRNVPEHLYVYSPETHRLVHDSEFILWANKGYEERLKRGTQNKKGVRTGGGPSKKTNPHPEELKILKLRQSGLSRKEVAEMLGISEGKVKRAVMQCSKFGYKLRLKPGPKKGCRGNTFSEETKEKIREKRASQTFSEESLNKRSESMKRHCKDHKWSRRKKQSD